MPTCRIRFFAENEKQDDVLARKFSAAGWFAQNMRRRLRGKTGIKDDMRIIELPGTAYERGLQQGLIFRDQFNVMMQTFFGSELWRENKPWFVPDAVLRSAMGGLGSALTRRAVEKTLPTQAERVRGLAKGLGISEGLAWGVQFLEIVFCEAGSSLVPPMPGGCTQLHVQPQASAKVGPILGRNYDFPNMLQPFQAARRERPAEKGRLASVCVGQSVLAGTHQGLNAAGLAVAANNARLPRGKDLRYGGVPYQMILSEILETCSNVDEAIRFITEFPQRGNAGFFGLADDSGDSAIVEFTASRAVVRRPGDDGVMAQTNHFVAMEDANLPAGTRWNVKGMEGVEFAFTTGRRYEVALAKLQERHGSITIEDVQEILRDHSANGGVGADHTVCVHGRSGSTLSSIVLDVKARTAWVANGAPCQNAYVPISLHKERAGRRAV